MAQTPENKTPPNTETGQTDTERKAQAAIGQAREGERAIGAAAQSTARQGGQAAQQATHQTGEMMRQGAATASEVAHAGAQAGTEATRRGVNALADGQRQILEEIAERYETVGRRWAQSVQENASDLRTMLVPPAGVTNNVRDMQDGVAGLVNGVVQSNMRATQEVLRMADPTAMFDLQRRFAREYIDTMLRGTSAFMRAARQTAEQTLRPIESQIEARQQRNPQGQGRRHGEEHGVVSDVMSVDVRVVTPDDTVQQATRLMRDEDTGILPVGEGDRLVGVVTDRDVTLRLVAEGKDPTRTKVREVMSQDLKYVFEDEDLEHVAGNMAEQQVRRMPVVNRNKRLVGVVSIGDLARGRHSGRYAGRAMRGIAAE